MDDTAERGPAPGPWSPAARAPAPVAPVYSGRRGRLFGLALSRMLLTVLTLGLGRFWMVTRLRRHYWSSISLAGDPFEYTGRAIEKLIGFLVALVILAVYLVVVNLALTFFGLSAFQGNIAALQAPLLALAPLWFWARYRARRYVLARTRWRGVRFGVEPGAWGYALRASLWWLATILSLGLLYPLMQLRLDRFMKDRTFFGDLRFEQRATLGPLFRSWLWTWLSVAVIAGGAVGLAVVGSRDGRDEWFVVFATLIPMLTFLVGAVALLRHKVFSFRHLASNTVLGGRTAARVTLGFWRVVGVLLSAAIVHALAVGAAFLVIAIVAAMIGFSLDNSSLTEIEAMMREDGLVASLLPLAVLAALYLPLVALWSALGHAFLTHPMIHAVCGSMVIFDLDAAGRARQRPEDAATEAGGFADALGADGF